MISFNLSVDRREDEDYVGMLGSLVRQMEALLENVDTADFSTAITTMRIEFHEYERPQRNSGHAIPCNSI